jgi:hypothetical protein
MYNFIKMYMYFRQQYGEIDSLFTPGFIKSTPANPKQCALALRRPIIQTFMHVT